MMPLILFASACEASTLTVGTQCYGGYSGIQEALDAASPGDTIEVLSGVYFERINVTKPVTLIGVGAPEINSSGFGSGIAILANGSTVEGFRVVNTGFARPACAAILVLSSGNTVRDNTLEGNWNAITLYRCVGNRIENNTVSGSQEGIVLLKSSGNIISANLVTSCEDGIYLEGSGTNQIAKNSVINNEDDGIMCIYGSSDNVIYDNVVTKNGWHGLESFLSQNNTFVSNNASGNMVCNVLLVATAKSLVKDNLAKNSSFFGISLTLSSENRLIGNTVNGNGMVGISLDSSDGNTLMENSASNNGVGGIVLGSSSSNMLWENRFAGNAKFDAYDDRSNLWDNGKVGNFYEKCSCKDKRGDGICDLGYPIPGGSGLDRYPLAI